MSKGTYTFKWSRPADEVFVTGSFDDWKKTEKLEKTVDGTHLGSVELSVEKITYKYVVDGTWTVDATQRIEKDASGNENNYLLPEDIVPKEGEPVFQIPIVPVIPDTADSATPFVQSVGPHATTADLAAEVPLEPPRDMAAEEAAATVVKDEPSEPPVTVSSIGPEATTAALAAEVPLEEVAAQEPIVPEATKAIVAPEDLPTPDPKSVPGYLPDFAEPIEPVDQVVSVNPIPASETADNPIHLEPNEPVPPSTTNVTDNVKLDKESYEQADASNLGVGATATAALAAVTEALTSAATTATETAKHLIPESVLPIVTGGATEPDHTTATTETVPEVVVVSQIRAEVEPEASAVPEAVEHKQEVEKELIAKTELAAPVEVTIESPRAEVPEVVRESQVEANALPEASASPVAVEAKKEIEAELKSEVKPAEPISEQPTEKPSEIPAVPEVVSSSIAAAGASPEATANPAAVEAKHEVEEAIAKQVKPEEPVKKEEEPSTAENAVAAVDKTADKVADKVADKAPSEKNSKKDSASDKAGKEKLKKRRRISAFFKKLLK